MVGDFGRGAVSFCEGGGDFCACALDFGEGDCAVAQGCDGGVGEEGCVGGRDVGPCTVRMGSGSCLSMEESV
jgi:hypothetical protein